MHPGDLASTDNYRDDYFAVAIGAGNHTISANWKLSAFRRFRQTAAVVVYSLQLFAVSGEDLVIRVLPPVVRAVKLGTLLEGRIH